MSEGDRGPGRRVVDGRFELESRLGGGGMGTVWRARDLALHRLVAVKEVRPPDVDLAEYDPDSARMLRERVLREARALARIDHPNVVTVHHIVDGGEGTYPWIVMELVIGGSLADRLAQGPMLPAEAARIGRGVLAALTAAHDAGIQHRDVKPANVLLRPDGRPVLTDFGIAAIRESTSLTATGSIIGTADFMAPERISGHEGGSASDLWSLAMMLYTAVEGHHPLRRGTTLATLAAVLHEDVPPPARAGALGDVLMSVLVRDVSARPSAAALDLRLAEIESGPPPARIGEEPTSYPLAPPPTTASSSTPPTTVPSPASATFGAPTGSSVAPGPAAAPWPTATPPGFGPPPVHPGPGQFPPHAGGRPGLGQFPPYAATAPVRSAGSGARRPSVLLGASGTALAGVVALLWWLLPLGGDPGGSEDPGGSNKGAGSASSSSTSDKKPTDTPTDATPAAQQPKEADGASMLTPDRIRTAIEAIEKETGRDRFGDFSVYDDYVSANVMVKGSDTKYDSYTYRPGQGVEKGIISSALSGGDQPFTPDDFDWDRIPALLEEAQKKLNVDDPKLRYVLVNQPNDTFGTPAGMAVYLSDDYASGFLETDMKGKVTRVVPAED
ncbi:protein kinase [Streptomyces sp. M41]|uniref:serine/threonine-protein kinase n=1 Tax=Streptomyces sp. M41 TaxID=3059412 RepID=UPI00374D7B7D